MKILKIKNRQEIREIVSMAKNLEVSLENLKEDRPLYQMVDFMKKVHPMREQLYPYIGKSFCLPRNVKFHSEFNILIREMLHWDLAIDTEIPDMYNIKIPLDALFKFPFIESRKLSEYFSRRENPTTEIDAWLNVNNPLLAGLFNETLYVEAFVIKPFMNKQIHELKKIINEYELSKCWFA